MVPKESDFHSPAHSPAVASRIGLALGVCFAVCLATGLISHGIQHPPSWFVWPSRPVHLYRVTQGLHVVSGVAAIPLLLAKMWSVYPKLFARPPVRSLPHALERVSILVLVAAAFFELVTGLFNVAQNYPWQFFFPVAHYAAAWIAVGALLVHIAVKLPIIRNALADKDSGPKPEGAVFTRRAFLRTTWGAAAAAVTVTAGATVPWLRDVSVLSWSSRSGLPVNRTALAAGVAVPPDWRLTLTGPAGTTSLSLADLNAMPQHEAELPIACVEGWSHTATWSGIRLADLVRLAGGTARSEVRVTSLEREGLYRASTLPAGHAADPLSLLALRLGGEVLSADHGFPCRIIAPNRPGVLQTKWVATMEVT